MNTNRQFVRIPHLMLELGHLLDVLLNVLLCFR